MFYKSKFAQKYKFMKYYVKNIDFRDLLDNFLFFRYITSLIQKDRQMEALVEKLCQRFKLSTDERQWRDLAYCLSLFTYTERSLRKLIENMDCYKDKLHCTGVMESLTTLINNTSKMAKNEIKSLVTELSDKIEECFAVRDKEDGEGDNNAVGDVRKEAPPGPASRATPRRKPAARRNRRHSSSSPDEVGIIITIPVQLVLDLYLLTRPLDTF